MTAASARGIWRVLCKEFVENLRDRRTLLSALFFGPLFGPVLFGVMVSHELKTAVADADMPVRLTVSGAERSPNLMRFLQARGISTTQRPLDEDAARAAVMSGAEHRVLIVPAFFAEEFRHGRPAPLLLVADSSDSAERKFTERVRAVLEGYASTVAQLRLQIRGIEPRIALPLAVHDLDTATPAGKAVVILGFMTYFVLFALLMGGLYLAIDTTAGERERGSLEPLLTLPVARSTLLGGKILATSGFMLLSLALTLIAFVSVFRVVSLNDLGMSSEVSWPKALALFAICIPFVPLGAILMTFVASFARSYREAQTYLTGVLLIPTLPIAFASIYALKARLGLMFIPSLSQHLLMTRVLKGEGLSPLEVAVASLSSLVLAAILFAATAAHWRRESFLG